MSNSRRGIKAKGFNSGIVQRRLNFNPFKTDIKIKPKAKFNPKRGNMERKDVIDYGYFVERKKVEYTDVNKSPNMQVDLGVLKRMYTILSPSGKEHNLLGYVKSVLNRLKIPFNEGAQGEIYNISPNKPLLCAHTDQVQRDRCDFVVQFKNYIYGMGGHTQTGLGADDKNGIWIVLNLVKQFGVENVSFLFSTMEEVGGMTDAFMRGLGEDITKTIPYALIFDRKGSGDIIGASNDYCMKDLETDLAELGKEFGYKPCAGVWSDCDHISNYVPCVNLSCGYYMPHTDKEYTDVNELINALDFGVKIIKTLNKVYDRVTKEPDTFYMQGKTFGWSMPSRFKTREVGHDKMDYPTEDFNDFNGDLNLNSHVIWEEVETGLSEEYLEKNYQSLEVIQGADGFYLSTESDLILLSEVVELDEKVCLEVYISENFKLTITNVGGYEVYLEHDKTDFFEEIAYRDGRV